MGKKTNKQYPLFSLKIPMPNMYFTQRIIMTNVVNPDYQAQISNILKGMNYLRILTSNSFNNSGSSIIILLSILYLTCFTDKKKKSLISNDSNRKAR